jgi:hypothetical protein
MELVNVHGPDLHPVQLELFRRATPQRRLAMARSMSSTAIEWSRRALRRLHPEMAEREVLLLWAEIHYGRALADQLRRHFAEDPASSAGREGGDASHSPSTADP